MTHLLRTKSNILIGAVAALMVAVLSASLLPITIGGNSQTSSVASINKHLSLGLDGGNMLPVVQTAASAATGLVGPFSYVVANAVGQATTLGAPGANTPITLGGCGFLGLGCAVHLVYDVFVAAPVECGVALIKTVFTFSLHGCTQAFTNILGDLEEIVAWIIAPHIKAMAIAIAQGMQKASLGWANWVLNSELSGNNVLNSPVVSCNIAQGNQKADNCQDGWFLGQYNMMRQVSLFMLLPFFMLVVIQSILRGSMYLLVRSAFVMLPVSIIGSVVAVFLVQILLNLSDDFVNLIGTYTDSATQWSTNFQQSVTGMDTTKINWYSLIWMFLLLFATVVIYIELLLRQTGVYMAALFLPLGFAAMVWPVAAGFIKKLIELLLGLIFSKVFIAAAVGLGITAFTNSSSTDVSQIPGGVDDATTAGLTSLISGSLIFCLAAFAGTKVIAMTPAAIAAAEGRTHTPSNFFNRLQLTNAGLRQAQLTLNRRNNDRGTGRGVGIGRLRVGGENSRPGFQNQAGPQPARGGVPAPRPAPERGTPAPPPPASRKV